MKTSWEIELKTILDNFCGEGGYSIEYVKDFIRAAIEQEKRGLVEEIESYLTKRVSKLDRKADSILGRKLLTEENKQTKNYELAVVLGKRNILIDLQRGYLKSYKL